MNVQQAIEILQKLPQDAKLMVPLEEAGGSLEVVAFAQITDGWIDVVLDQEPL